MRKQKIRTFKSLNGNNVREKYDVEREIDRELLAIATLVMPVLMILLFGFASGIL